MFDSPSPVKEKGTQDQPETRGKPANRHTPLFGNNHTRRFLFVKETLGREHFIETTTQDWESHGGNYGLRNAVHLINKESHG